MSKQVFHGGGLAKAMHFYGGKRAEWLDLSTAINPRPISVPDVEGRYFTELPDHDVEAQAIEAARVFYNVPDDAAILPIAGIQDVIAVLPLLRAMGSAAIFRHGYGEYRAALSDTGWRVDVTHELAQLRKVDLAIVVNPNNPDANSVLPNALEGIAATLAAKNGLLIVDEAFADLNPAGSMVGHAGAGSILVLKSFGKFFGLAGIRLGFAIGHADEIAALRRRIGPWTVAGPALAMGAEILMRPCIAENIRLSIEDMSQTQLEIYAQAKVNVAANGGLFHLLEVKNAADIQTQLCQKHQILTRCFDYSKHWLRLGLCKSDAERIRLKTALMDVCHG